MTNNEGRRLWITWERQRRNQSMAAWLSADLYEYNWCGNRWIRYPVLCLRTYRLLRRERPDIVFFQNPSIVLASFVTLLRKLRLIDCKIVGDFHNGGVFPPYGKAIARWVARNSDFTIVTNDNLAVVIEGWGAQAVVVPDPLPVIHRGSAVCAGPIDAKSFVFLFVCSWASDEPIANVVAAAALVSKDYPFFKIFITGKPQLDRYLRGVSIPESVTLTRFLPTHEFDALLSRANVVMDFTTRADCMVCGAYEAVAAEKPAILSDNPPTRDYFSQGMLFTDNSATDIAAKMVESFQRFDAIDADVRKLKTDIQNKERQKLRTIEALIRGN